MTNKKLNLPEKDFFTFDEVAQRWGVSVNAISYYVWDLGILRIAIPTFRNRCDKSAWMYIQTDDDLEDVRFLHGFCHEYIDVRTGDLSDSSYIYFDISPEVNMEIINSKNNYGSVDDDYYIVFTSQQDLKTNLCIAEFYTKNGLTDFYGNKIILRTKRGLKIREKREGINKNQEWIEPDFEIFIQDGYYITKEEVERFEDEYSSNNTKNGDSYYFDGSFLRKEEQRINVVISAAKKFSYNPMQIPGGGKSKIKRHLLDKNPSLFTNSTFDKAWNAASVRGLISIENKERFKQK